MPQTLHITNGDCTGDMLRQSSFLSGGDILIWRDILHKGPVPNKPMAEIDDLRTQYLSSYFSSSEPKKTKPSYEDIHDGFKQRQLMLEQSIQYDDIILWFEHDLYDQLQLIQILDYYATSPVKNRLHLICINKFDGVEPFYGLGNLTLEQLEKLHPTRAPVTSETYKIARTAWAAFTDTSPQKMFNLTQQDTCELPYLKKAFIRFLEEFPDRHTGLSKTEFLILKAIDQQQENTLSSVSFHQIFSALQKLEDHPFMGDIVIKIILARLCNHKHPFIKHQAQGYQLSPLGRKIISGETVDIKNLAVNKWFGGTQLTPDNFWFWDRKKHSIVKAVA